MAQPNQTPVKQISKLAWVLIGLFGFCFLGVILTGIKRFFNPPKPFETTIATPEGGKYIESVTIKRDMSGRVTTEWKTTLPDSTKAYIIINKAKPQDTMGLLPPIGSVSYSIPVNGAFFQKHDEPKIGDYYVCIYVTNNGIWKQPKALQALFTDQAVNISGLKAISYSQITETKTLLEKVSNKQIDDLSAQKELSGQRLAIEIPVNFPPIQK